ncbi:MAG: hypothetical protein ACJA2S_003306 [Cyclobacteriaceae bacterium]|jgi:hypothetical protein
MNHIKKVLLLIIGVFTAQLAIAQGPGGGQGGQRRSPADMVKVEMTMVLDSITSLSEDQKMIIDAVYEDYQTSLTTLLTESAGNREGMREKMQAIRATKDESLEGVLTEEQVIKYKELMKNRGAGRGQGGQGRGGRGQQDN